MCDTDMHPYSSVVTHLVSGILTPASPMGYATTKYLEHKMKYRQGSDTVCLFDY